MSIGNVGEISIGETSAVFPVHITRRTIPGRAPLSVPLSGGYTDMYWTATKQLNTSKKISSREAAHLLQVSGKTLGPSNDVRAVDIRINRKTLYGKGEAFRNNLCVIKGLHAWMVESSSRLEAWLTKRQLRKQGQTPLAIPKVCTKLRNCVNIHDESYCKCKLKKMHGPE